MCELIQDYICKHCAGDLYITFGGTGSGAYITRKTITAQDVNNWILVEGLHTVSNSETLDGVIQYYPFKSSIITTSDRALFDFNNFIIRTFLNLLQSQLLFKFF